MGSTSIRGDNKLSLALLVQDSEVLTKQSSVPSKQIKQHNQLRQTKHNVPQAIQQHNKETQAEQSLARSPTPVQSSLGEDDLSAVAFTCVNSIRGRKATPTTSYNLSTKQVAPRGLSKKWVIPALLPTGQKVVVALRPPVPSGGTGVARSFIEWSKIHVNNLHFRISLERNT